MVTVYPEPGNEKTVAQALFAAAADRSQVRTTTQPRRDGTAARIGFVVPDDVFEKFNSGTQSDGGTQVLSDSPVKKRGRPRKEQEQQ